jgi:rare lipoprotein A
MTGRGRSRRTTVGGLALIAMTVPAVAISAAGAAPAPVPMKVTDARLTLGQPLEARGTLPAADRGRTVELQYRRAGATAWHRVAATRAGASGAYRVRAGVQTSGSARVVLPAPGSAASDGGASPTSAASTPASVVVGAAVQPTATKLNPLAGHEAAVRGRLLPGRAGRTVKLQGLVGGRWTTWDTARTRSSGAYRLAFVPRRLGRYPTRVSFAGDRANAAAKRATRPLDVFRRARATWYGPGLYGNGLACGGRLSTATIGVAHKTLPCGTRLTLRYRGRELRAKVIDRGPYGPADYDLTAATKWRLGYPDVGTVLATK